MAAKCLVKRDESGPGAATTRKSPFGVICGLSGLLSGPQYLVNFPTILTNSHLFSVILAKILSAKLRTGLQTHRHRAGFYVLNDRPRSYGSSRSVRRGGSASVRCLKSCRFENGYHLFNTSDTLCPTGWNMVAMSL